MRHRDRPGVHRPAAARAGRRRAAAGPRASAPSTPTSAPSGSAASRSACPTAHLETLLDADDLGLAVRVVVDGTWGFAAASTSPRTPRRRRRRAGGRASPGWPPRSTPSAIELAAEPGYGDVTWVSAYDVDPFDVPRRGQGRRCWRSWSARLLGARRRRPRGRLAARRSRRTSSTPTAATTATQQRVRLHPEVTAVAVSRDGRFETMRTLAPPAGRGWEYLHRHRLGLRRRAGRAARAAGREAGRAVGRGRAATTWSSTRPTCG